jgi:hypothetical protein
VIVRQEGEPAMLELRSNRCVRSAAGVCRTMHVITNTMYTARRVFGMLSSSRQIYQDTQHHCSACRIHAEAVSALTKSTAQQQQQQQQL